MSQSETGTQSNPPTDEDFGRRLRRLLEEGNLSQAELAEQAEVAPAAVSRLIAGDRVPHVDQVLAMARALGVTPGTLVQGTTAATVLDAWVTRAQFETEATMRAAAQVEVEVLAHVRLAEEWEPGQILAGLDVLGNEAE